MIPYTSEKGMLRYFKYAVICCSLAGLVLLAAKSWGGEPQVYVDQWTEDGKTYIKIELGESANSPLTSCMTIRFEDEPSFTDGWRRVVFSTDIIVYDGDTILYRSGDFDMREFAEVPGKGWVSLMTPMEKDRAGLPMFVDEPSGMVNVVDYYWSRGGSFGYNSEPIYNHGKGRRD